MQVTLIPGDGIGPSLTRAAARIVEATGVSIEWIEAPAGEEAHRKTGYPVPKETLAAVRKTGLVLKGPCATPVGAGFRSVDDSLRQEFDLYANIRPAKAFRGVPCLFPGLDLVVVRENTEGLYTSMEHWVGAGHQSAMGIAINTRAAMERVCRFAFELARAQGRKKVTVVHKADVMKILSGLILEVAREIAGDYPDLEFEDRIVDQIALELVQDPHQFDVLVTTNLFGDILSNLAAGLIGGLPLVPGAKIGEKVALFEATPTRDSRPDPDDANPTSLVLASALMLRYAGRFEEATAIEKAVAEVIETGKAVTRDLRKDGVGTPVMVDAIVERVRAHR